MCISKSALDIMHCQFTCLLPSVAFTLVSSVSSALLTSLPVCGFRYEKRHTNIAAHVSPCFRVKEGDNVTIGQCRCASLGPLSPLARPLPSPISPIPFCLPVPLVPVTDAPSACIWALLLGHSSYLISGCMLNCPLHSECRAPPKDHPPLLAWPSLMKPPSSTPPSGP